MHVQPITYKRTFRVNFFFQIPFFCCQHLFELPSWGEFLDMTTQTPGSNVRKSQHDNPNSGLSCQEISTWQPKLQAVMSGNLNMTTRTPGCHVWKSQYDNPNSGLLCQEISTWQPELRDVMSGNLNMTTQTPCCHVRKSQYDNLNSGLSCQEISTWQPKLCAVMSGNLNMTTRTPCCHVRKSQHDMSLLKQSAKNPLFTPTNALFRSRKAAKNDNIVKSNLKKK